MSEFPSVKAAALLEHFLVNLVLWRLSARGYSGSLRIQQRIPGTSGILKNKGWEKGALFQCGGLSTLDQRCGRAVRWRAVRCCEVACCQVACCQVL